MPLPFYPSPQGEEAFCRQLGREFAEKWLRPTAIEDDEACRFRREHFDKAASLGLAALALPKEVGGGGKSYLCHYAALEEIARASLAMAVTIGVTNLVQGALLAYGTRDQKEEFLKPLATGRLLGAFSLSEPQSGSDAAGLRLAAKRDGNGYRLTGTKCWCSTAGHADIYLVMARTAEHKTKGITSFLVPKDTPGFRVGKLEDKLGLRASSLGELVFDGAFIPDHLRVGEEGQGFSVALSQLDAGRITIGMAGIALATEALDRAWRYLAEQPESFSEGTQQEMAQRFAEIQALRCLLREAAHLRDKREKLTILAAQVKLLGSDLAMAVTGEAIGWIGVRGACQELELERLFRDAKALPIVEGTNQIQRLVLARELKEAMP